MNVPLAAELDPARLASLLGSGISADLVSRMLAVPRLEASCRRLLDRRIGVSAPALPPTAEAALSLDGLALLALAHRAGAVWHAPLILSTIDGTAVRALVAAIGARARATAIRHAALAPPPEQGNALSPVAGQGSPLSAEMIAADGMASLAAWCESQPTGVGRRVMLRLPFSASVSIDDRYRRHAPPIVDALLSEAG
ncbi:hypothetical protein [Rhizosaccharibacter radicis]|uniref:Uncharacterized protein n=1 Tax=Rhizosaccharibacter radicis TaxID=2782605 RepID=A0ABT1VTE5_9PROT|nr:hypothetical protein [Acetobacteraceae bacterium KSS12]